MVRSAHQNFRHVWWKNPRILLNLLLFSISPFGVFMMFNFIWSIICSQTIVFRFYLLNPACLHTQQVIRFFLQTLKFYTKLPTNAQVGQGFSKRSRFGHIFEMVFIFRKTPFLLNFSRSSLECLFFSKTRWLGFIASRSWTEIIWVYILQI